MLRLRLATLEKLVCYSCLIVYNYMTLVSVLDAFMGEIIPTCAKAEWLIKHGENYLKPEHRHSSLLTFYKKAEVHFEPLGVVAAIVSWNYRSCYYWVLDNTARADGILSPAQRLVSDHGIYFCW